MILTYIAMLFVLGLVLALAIMILRIPIVIARGRGISGGTLTTIAVLAWLGIFAGITWIAALILSLLMVGNTETVEEIDPIDQLAKLHKLHKSGAITTAEFNREKRKLLQ